MTFAHLVDSGQARGVPGYLGPTTLYALRSTLYALRVTLYLSLRPRHALYLEPLRGGHEPGNHESE
eukprot:CAMPEP_0118868424 /NCGR_PEP_ID=MMETSP1163-20130328/11892_1 /TAXON_ID=124430 /ORGANISM="Phaeomonas parva, Strain CCMP2877" /LENGTH=65 /DNA_ID=CAMNT_0006803099 /DNA_START=212 /DNA_END=407 /DNA_ORIENTATION=-